MRIRSIFAVFLLAPLALSCGGSDDGDGATDTTPAISIEEIAAGDFVVHGSHRRAANGEPVLLLHGFPETSYEWRSQLEALARAGYRAIAPDQRGYSPGARPTADADYSVVFMVLDAVAIADELGFDRFHVVGHDWGAAVAWGLGTLFPQRVRTLSVLSIPHPDAFSAALADQTSCQYSASSYFDLSAGPAAVDLFLANDAAFLRAIYQGVSADAVDEYVALLSTPEAMSAALAWYRANITGRVLNTPQVGAITVPTLFVWSDGDFAICRDVAEATGNNIDAPYHFEVIEGVNHWLAENASERMNELLLEQLRGGA